MRRDFGSGKAATAQMLEITARKRIFRGFRFVVYLDQEDNCGRYRISKLVFLCPTRHLTLPLYVVGDIGDQDYPRETGFSRVSSLALMGGSRVNQNTEFASFDR